MQYPHVPPPWARCTRVCASPCEVLACRVCCCFLPECVLFLTKIIQAHSLPATSFTLHSTLSVIIWQVTHSFCTAFSAHSHITQNGIHSHARGPHSVRIHASALAIIRIHSRRTAFSDTSYAIHSLSFITVYIHFRHNSHSKRATFNTDIIHGHSRSYTNCHIHVQPHSRYIHRAAGARPPRPHTQRVSFSRSVHSFSFITDRIHQHSNIIQNHACSVIIQIDYHSDIIRTH